MLKQMMLMGTAMAVGVFCGMADELPSPRIMMQFESYKVKTVRMEALVMKHQDAGALRKEVAGSKGGELYDLQILSGDSGESCELRSSWLHVFPTEYDPPCMACGGKGVLKHPEPVKEEDLYLTPTAFEEVGVGAMMEVEARYVEEYIGEVVDFDELTKEELEELFQSLDEPKNEEDYKKSIYLEFEMEDRGVVKFSDHFMRVTNKGKNPVTLTDFWERKEEGLVRLDIQKYAVLSYGAAVLPNGKKDKGHVMVTFVRALVR